MSEYNKRLKLSDISLIKELGNFPVTTPQEFIELLKNKESYKEWYVHLKVEIKRKTIFNIELLMITNYKALEIKFHRLPEEKCFFNYKDRTHDAYSHKWVNKINVGFDINPKSLVDDIEDFTENLELDNNEFERLPTKKYILNTNPNVTMSGREISHKHEKAEIKLYKKENGLT